MQASKRYALLLGVPIIVGPMAEDCRQGDDRPLGQAENSDSPTIPTDRFLIFFNRFLRQKQTPLS